MNLTALAIRIAAVHAIKGATSAGASVFDSRIDPVHLAAQEARTPVIIISTDDDTYTPDGKNLMGGARRLALVIEICMTEPVMEADPENPDEMVAIVPATDAGLDAAISLLCWQASRALSSGGGAWGDVFRSLVTTVSQVEVRRGADLENGVRYAARQIVLNLDHVDDPLGGSLPDKQTAWGYFLAAMRDNPALANIGGLIETTITADALPDWRVMQGALGLPDDAAGVLASKPIEGGALFDGVDISDV